MDHSRQDSWTVWQWLDEKSWLYNPMWELYQSPCGRKYISSKTLWLYPGDVIHYLKTGYLRNVAIFDTFLNPPETLGFRRHKDGTCVSIRRIK